MLSLFLNGIDSNNLGKGMWAWTLSTSMTNDGFSTSNYAGWFSFLKNTQHLDYVITKAGAGDSRLSQYTSTVVNAAHAAGLKIFPYFYIYGDHADENPSIHSSTGEANVFNQVFGAGGPGGDAAIFDIESEYGNTDSAGLQNYFNLIGKSASGTGSGSRDHLFMAYSTYDILRFHYTQLPVKTIADYCDAAMPQMYWKAHGYSIATDLSMTDADYRNTTYLGTNGIKPVIMTGQTYDAGSGNPTASETNQWYNAIKNDSNAVGGTGAPSGWRYKSFNYFDEHTVDRDINGNLTPGRPQRAEIASETIGDRPGTPILSSPGSNAVVRSGANILLNWSDVVNTYGSGSVGAALYYDVYLDNMASPITTISYSAPSAPVSQWSIPGTLADGVHQWKIIARNMFGSTSSAVRSFTVDSTPPTASYGGQTPFAGEPWLDFTITYTDATTALDTTSVDNSDITVTGPDGYSAGATFIGLSGNIVTYRIPAPGGTWSSADSGTYTITQNGTQIKDTAGNWRPAGAIGTINAQPAFAWMSGSTLNVEFDGTTTPIALGADGSSITATRDGVTLSFNDVSSVVAVGTPSDDNLQLASELAAPLTFNNADGNDTLRISGGAYGFSNDLGGAMGNVAVSVDADSQVTFDSSQHLRALSIEGSARIGAGADKVLVLSGLSIAPGGSLDLTDNDLIVRGGVIGTWDGSNYGGISGSIANGLIFSSTAQARSTTLGTATAGQLFGLTSGQTATWSGQTVSASDVLVKFTYVGDANLDGKVNIDDYGRIDANVGQSGSVFGWYSGDFNFDGKINIDDYGLIDSIIGAQGPVL